MRSLPGAVVATASSMTITVLVGPVCLNTRGGPARR
ncbi:Uncharacterised protein [Mycobacteroides abscessus subsp. abscessus]|nr:Uncharacterised protein [Mycobacteroides abscessus subsp. abscessus]